MTARRHYDWNGPAADPVATEPADGEAVEAPSESERIARALRNSPAYRPGGIVGQLTAAFYGAPDPAEVARQARAKRRAEWVERAKATQQFLIAGILAMLLVVALVAGWNFVSWNWQWWA